jgi:hypothetical protein
MADDDSSSKAVVLKVFGPELGERLAVAAGHGRGKNYRGVLEPTDAVTQCEKAGSPFVPGMKCYLCNQPIPAKEELSGPDDELYVECEHIFSVTEARWYLDIYMTRRPPGDPWTKEAVRLEYAQAHRVCNQAKSNYNFFTGNASGTPVLNMVGIRKILLNIQARARKNISKYAKQPRLQTIMTNIANEVTKQASAIADRVTGILAQIQANAPKDEGSQAMTVLVRSSLLADPETLPPSLRQIHDAWYANAPAAREKAESLFRDFVTQTYSRYPQLQPTTLYGLLFAGLSLPTQDVQIPQSAVETVLSAYFKQVPADESSEKLLLSSVYSALYLHVLTTLLQQPVTDATLDTVCALSTRLAIVLENEPKVVSIVGPPPSLPESLKARCEILSKNRERAYRTEARDLNQSLDELVDPPTAEEDADYFLGELARRLSARLQTTYGMANESADRAAGSISASAREAFLETYPEGIDRAKEAAANVAVGLVSLGFMRTNPEAAEKLGDQVYKFILNSRTSETVTYGGGLQARRGLYSNHVGGAADVVPRNRPGLYAGLRKRPEPRRTARVRQHTRKSRTRRQRHALDRV